MGAGISSMYIGSAGQIGDGVIGLGKLTPGTAGNLIGMNAAGTSYEAIDQSTAGKILTSNGAGAAATFQAAGTAYISYATSTEQSPSGLVTAGATKYWPFYEYAKGGFTPAAAESARSVAGFNGTIQKFWFYVSSNTVSAASTVSIMINGSPLGNVNVNAGATGYYEATAIATAVADNQLLSLKLVAGAGGTNIQISGWGMLASGVST